MNFVTNRIIKQHFSFEDAKNFVLKHSVTGSSSKVRKCVTNFCMIYSKCLFL